MLTQVANLLSTVQQVRHGEREETKTQDLPRHGEGQMLDQPV